MMKAPKSPLSIAFRALAAVAVCLWVVSCVFPFVWMMYSSLKTEPEFARSILSLPSRLNFGNYRSVIQKSQILHLYANSLINVCVSIPLLIFVSFLIGYILARYQFRGKSALRLFLAFGLLIPIHGLLVPLFIQLNFLKMLNGRFTLILPYVATGIPVSVFLIEGYVGTVPFEIEEAAMIDSCNLFQRVFMFVFPLCTPILAVDIILHFLSYWNEFPFALVLNSGIKYRTIMLGMTIFEGQFTQIYTEKMTFLTLAVLPILIIYLYFNKKIIQGMTAGAVKG
jgi:raffinose/stachyose/melibiose transport system permease protein